MGGFTLDRERAVVAAVVELADDLLEVNFTINGCSIRLGDHHRVLGTLAAETITWLWIGTHAAYGRLISS